MTQYSPESYDASFNMALGRTLSRLRDVTIRDGQQSWDSNRWSNADSVDVIRLYGEYAALVKTHTGYDVPPIEVSGGGEYLQPARFLGENPFDNLCRLKQAAPDLTLQSLYRGRQGFAFTPSSDEIQYYAIYHSTALGNGVLRCFDMMNDADNLIPAIKSFFSVYKTQKQMGLPFEKCLKFELAVSYMSPPAIGDSAMDIADYIQFIVHNLQFIRHTGINDFKLSQSEILSSISVVYKDYASQIIDTETVKQIISQTRHDMNKAGFDNVPLNLHSHGQKPHILYTALNAGAMIVDTAIGDLSDGPSHTNITDMITLLMQDFGFCITHNDYEKHPVLQKIKQLESVIAQISTIHKPYRMPLDMIDADVIAQHKIASGAASALWSLIQKRWKTQIKPQIHSDFLSDFLCDDDDKNKITLFTKTLESIYNFHDNTGVWINAGQFNTVTPGSTIAYDQALLQALSVLSKRPLPLGQHNQAYKNLVMGRYGKNHGMDKGMGDQDLRKAYFLESGIDVLKNHPLEIDAEYFEYLMMQSDLKDFLNDQSKFSIHREHILRHGNLERLKILIADSHLSDSLKQKFLYAVTPNVFPVQNDGLDKGREQVTILEQEGLVFCDDKPNFGLSKRDESALLIMLLFTLDKGYEIGKNVLRYQNDKIKTRIGDIEMPRYGDIIMLVGDKINAMAYDMAKLEILEEILLNKSQFSAEKIAKTHHGMRVLHKRFFYQSRQILNDLKSAGYGDKSALSHKNLMRAKQGVRFLAVSEKDRLKQEFVKTPPAIWDRVHFKIV